MDATVELPPVLAIGFTGHRVLPDEERCRRAIYEFLAERKRTSKKRLYGVSSVASGGDLLFAESCLALDIPLRVLLPLTVNDFRADFEPDAWQRAEEVMSKAISVETLEGCGCRKECYYECGLETVQQSELLLTVWNGEPAHGIGGTEEIVTFARKMGKEVVWIHSVTGERETLNRGGPDIRRSDEELKFLNELPGVGVRAADGSACALVEAWQKKLSRNATRVAPQVKRLAAIPIVLTAAAAFASAAALHVRSTQTWVIVGGALGASAAVLPAVMRLSMQQTLWVRIRTAAEVSRSILSQWEISTQFQIPGPEVLPELNGMLLSMNLLRLEERRSAPEFEQFRDRYLETRVFDQKEYFEKQSLKAERRGRRYRFAAKILVGCAVVISVFSFVSERLLKTHYTRPEMQWLALGSSALFQLAAIASALLVVHDCDRRQRRYAEMHSVLARWEIELRALHTWHSAMPVMQRIERALLIELLEWRALMQNRKMPRS